MKTVLIVVLIIVLGILGYSYLGRDTKEGSSTTHTNTPSQADVSNTETPVSPTPQSVDTENSRTVGTDIGMELPTVETESDIETRVDTPPPVPVASPKIFAVAGVNYGYDVKEIRVKKGDTVTINFTSTSGFHDWVVDEFNAATEKIQAGGTSSVTFVADKVGTFEYYCSVGSHRKMGMVGKLIVE